MLKKGVSIIASVIILLSANANASASSKSVKRGEKLFMEYCSGCHSLTYTTYPEVSMPRVEAESWFGIVPPDLTLVAKYRGTQWLQDYLQGFYQDSSRPFGCNNRILPNVQMPNVLFPLKGTSSYQQTIDDLLSFLEYASDPSADSRHVIGIFVVLFYLILSVLVWLFYRNYRGT